MSRSWSFGILFLLAWGLAGCHSTGALPALPPLPAWQSPEGREHAELGQIRETASGELLTPSQLVERLAAAPRVVVGEQHDNPDHHALQLWLLQALNQQRPQGSLLLEMLEPVQQDKVDAVRQQQPLPDDLATAIDWRQGWDWTFYAPLLREAFSRGYPLLAANLDRDEMKSIYRNPPTLSGPRTNAPAVREVLLEEVRAGHCGMLPESQLPAMLAVQQQRDRRMAQRLLQAPAPALLLAGGQHARKDVGVPLHLADLGAVSGNPVLMLVQVGEQVGAQEADYVWFTAALPKRDYCADLK
ncbi:ChaN family lipoprotein [Pseudomonas japonica]|uniref:ChaN family lipoprotein n=1 Tax=Pseudomonas japonica TaxID=256466 RepID=UPI0037FC122F